jgi:hypothetical protein
MGVTNKNNDVDGYRTCMEEIEMSKCQYCMSVSDAMNQGTMSTSVMVL